MPGPDCSRRELLALLAAAGALPGALLSPPVRASQTGAAPALSPSALPALDLDALAGWIGGPGTFTLSNATLVDHTGAVRPGAGVRVEDGVVVELGPGVTGGEDLGGAWLAPGLVEAGSSLGLVEVLLEGGTRDDAEGGAVTPAARVVDGYNPLSELIPVARLHGVAHGLVLPRVSGLVPGTAAVVALAGRTVAEAAVAPEAGLVVGLGGAGRGGEGGPSSRMGVTAQLRKLLLEAEAPEEEAEEEEDRPRRFRRRKVQEGDPAEEDEAPELPAEATWRRVRAGALPVLFAAQRADDILTALELAAEFELRAVILGGAESWIVLPELQAAEVPVILGPVTTQPSTFEHPRARFDTAARLHASGVPFALRTGSAHNARELPVQAGIAVAHGLPWAAAVHAITGALGGILGLPGLGRLEPGQPATLFEVAGDPLQPRHPVRRMWIGGRPVSLETRQTRLYERYRELR